MIEWQRAYNDLKQRYFVQSKERLDQLVQLIEQVRDTNSDPSVLREISHHFHWLAGSGGIYGLPELTRLGKQAEQYCENALQSDRCTASSMMLTHFVESARQAFAEGEKRTQKDSDPAVAGTTSTALTTEDPVLDILLVDEDQARLAKFADLLRESSIEVEFAGGYTDGLSQITSKSFDGLIVSVPLTDGSGYDLIEQFRTAAACETQPALLISHTAGLLDKVRAVHCGADAFFEEPFVYNDVAERLHFLLEVPDAPHYRILYVEDDPYQAEFGRSVLSSAGYSVQLCSSAAEFDELLTSHQPDLVILDIMLPDVNGYDLARFLRQNEHYATLPIVFMTTEARIDAKIRAAKAGGDDYLIKPVPPSLLLSTVAAKLERSRFLKSLLHRDGLTKLLTHTAFMNLAQMAIARKIRIPEKSIGLIMIDIDRFKSINDNYGHPVGDRVIVSLSNLLRRRMRRADLVGRYGGEEFVIVVEDLAEVELAALAQRLLSEFSAINHYSDKGSFQVTFSGGIAMFDAANMELKDWIRTADQALLHAKQSGRNRLVRGPIAAQKTS